MIKRRMLLSVALLWMTATLAFAQELKAKVTVTHQQVPGTESGVFEELKDQLEEFVNNQKWTTLNFQEVERIPCSININVQEHKVEGGQMTCTAMIQANRPVFNSSYNSTFFQIQDREFTFIYNQFDKVEFNPEIIDNQLTALMAYYAYLIIGINLDTFSPKGGEDILQQCLNLTNNAQQLDFPGWKAYEKDRNRFGIINDYLEGAMEPFRNLQYDYYRKGLDEMATNVERGRAAITEAMEAHLQKAHEDRPSSAWPQIWTDFKRDELVNIYKGKGTPKEKETLYDLLMRINASQNSSWSKIKE